MRRLYLLICMGFAVPLMPLCAAPVRDRVIAVEDGAILVFAQTGKAQLDGVVLPDEARAQEWLALHALQQELQVEPQGDDRYGRMRVRSTLQPAMLAAGVAVLFPQAAIPETWVAAEETARRARRGVWAGEGFVLAPDSTAAGLYRFHVVEGTITRIYKGRSATYLNFGERWQDDFSVTIAGRHRRSFEPLLGGLKPGSRVRVRGTIYPENGPMIKITRPEQLQLLP